VTVPILYGIVTVLGIIGNSLVIYVIVSKERMRTTTNFLLLNLAVADLSFVSASEMTFLLCRVRR